MKDKNINSNKKMYNLCWLDKSVHDNSVLGHPFTILFRTENLEKMSEEIKKRIVEGWRKDRLFVFVDMGFELKCFVRWKQLL